MILDFKHVYLKIISVPLNELPEPQIELLKLDNTNPSCKNYAMKYFCDQAISCVAYDEGVMYVAHSLIVRGKAFVELNLMISSWW